VLQALPYHHVGFQEGCPYQVAFGSNVSASNAKALDAKGKESAGKRGKSFEPNQVKLSNAEDEDGMRNAAKRSVEHVT